MNEYRKMPENKEKSGKYRKINPKVHIRKYIHTRSGMKGTGGICSLPNGKK